MPPSATLPSLGAAAVALTVAAAAVSPTLADGDPAHGRLLAETRCGGCHAPGPSGDSPVAGVPPLRSFAARWPVESLAEGLAEGLVSGHVEMPEFIFTPDEIADFLAYLDTL